MRETPAFETQALIGPMSCSIACTNSRHAVAWVTSSLRACA